MPAYGLYRFMNAAGADFTAFSCFFHMLERKFVGWFTTEHLGIVKPDRRHGGLDRRIPRE
jgi:hypothetical protein